MEGMAIGMKWIKKLFCNHHYIKDVPWLQFYLSRGIICWKCIKCDKVIRKDDNWVPFTS